VRTREREKARKNEGESEKANEKAIDERVRSLRFRFFTLKGAATLCAYSRSNL